MEEKKEIRVSNTVAETEEPFLVARSRRGDKTAFGKLVRMHQKKVLRMVVGMTGGLDSAMDIVQESFIRAYQALDRFEEGQPFYPWVSKIASNLAINYIKKSSRETSLDNETQQRADGALDPLAQLQIDETDRRFMAAVGELPTPYRAVFILRSFEELSYEEIATRLDISPGTVDSRLYRARRILVDKLKEFLE
ncbi:MAG: sigma-70 family RNA polymerase sigma factor [FCB group bacterium]|nr:sigma-70 family RNA polymerase sigma factor [FCB group bacterium]